MQRIQIFTFHFVTEGCDATVASPDSDVRFKLWFPWTDNCDREFPVVLFDIFKYLSKSKALCNISQKAGFFTVGRF
jgi:hypothetical protein